MRKLSVSLALMFTFLFVQSASANLVYNGGFETGNFSGWTLSGNTTQPAWFSVWTTNPHSGTYAVEAGPYGSPAYISQTLSTTPGQTYRLSFWLSNPGNADGSEPNEVMVSWGGNTVWDQVNIPVQPYTEYHLNLPASSASTILTVGFRDDPAFLYFDDISVDAVPVPGTLVLLGSGLLSFLGWRRLRKC